MPSVGPYCSARADASAATRAMSAATSSAGNVARVGQPAGERDDLGPRGDRHEVAHRGGLHDLRAARRTARRSARGRARRPRPAHAAGFAAGRRAPWRLVYRHAASGTLADAWTSSSTSSRAPGWRPRSGSGPFLPVLLAGALAAADLGLDFDGHGLRVPRGVAVPARRARPRRGARLRRPPRRARRGGPAAALVRAARPRARARRAARRRRRSPTSSSTGGPGRSPASACAALGFQAARSLFGRVRQRLDDQAARRAARLRRGRRAGAAGVSHPLPAARARRDRRRARRGCSPAAAGARARSTPVCGSCAERRGAARSSSSRSSTR